MMEQHIQLTPLKPSTSNEKESGDSVMQYEMVPMKDSYTPPASPYSRRKPRNRELESEQICVDEFKRINSADFVINDFDYSLDGSPYAKRHPMVERLKNGTDYEAASFTVDSVQWTPCESLCDFQIETDDFKNLQFPVEIHRAESMYSLRNRRDQSHAGNRAIRSKRVIDKAGEEHIDYINIPRRSVQFFKDFVNTLIDERWRYVILVFTLSYFCCWILFAVLWYLIANAHGDLLFDEKTGERLGDGDRPCVEGASSFAGFLLFSIETQVSIGYGNKYPHEECPEALFLMVIQLVIGVAIEGAMVGIVYAKMIRPTRHLSNMQFSKKALICQRNGRLCLLVRLCDIIQAQVIHSKVRAYYLSERITYEGEHLRQHQQEIKLDNKGDVFMIFPYTICHIIDQDSPLYNFTARDVLEKKFEIIVTLTGSSRSTGQMTQARTSYLHREIMWGHRFMNIVSYDKNQEGYVVDFTRFDETIPIDTPLCSAKQLDEIYSQVHNYYDNPNEYMVHSDSDSSGYLGHPHHNEIDNVYSMEPIGDIVIEPIPSSSMNKSKSQEDLENIQNEKAEDANVIIRQHQEKQMNDLARELTNRLSEISQAEERAKRKSTDIEKLNNDQV